MTLSLRSPVTGRVLTPDTPHSVAAPGERWPVVDAIPYLRTGRGGLVTAALGRLDAGDRDGALVLLLADQDEWWDGPPPAEADLRDLVRRREHLTLRDAMGRLAYGRVGDYFAHRWSDPTFLAGLALVEAHWTAPAGAFELACGIGHYLRELGRRGVAVSGADVVFSKLWLARHWVVGGGAELVCFDAAGPWPIAPRADLVLCQDAFYFLEPKGHVLDGLRRAAEPGGLLAVGHIHNRDAPNMSAGAGVSAAEIAAFFPDGLVYDDDELTRSAVEARAPAPRAPAELAAVEAFSVAAGPGRPAVPAQVRGRLLTDDRAEGWRLNPLYAGSPEAGYRIAWPSDRYRREYEARATYRLDMRRDLAAGRFAPDAMRRREAVALPERW